MNKKILENIGLYFITDSALTKKSVIADVEAAIKGGVKIVQYRENKLNTKEMINEAKKIKEICKKHNALFIINNRVDICLAVDADGVHLGQNDMPCNTARKLLGNKIIGITINNLKEAIEAEKCADYVAVSPIFHTETKADIKKPVGLKLIKEVKEKIKIPFVAVGGINQTNLKGVLMAGTRNVAMVSAIITKDDVEKAVREVNKIIKDSNLP